MTPPDRVLFIVASTFLVGILFFGCTVPSLIKLKDYRIFSGKAEREENTVEVKCTIWSVLFSMVWICVLVPLSIVALDFWPSPVRIDVKIVLSGWPIYLLSLFCLSFLLVLLGHQAVFDEYGMTVKKRLWGKPFFVPWNRVTTVDYDMFSPKGEGQGFHFSYLPEKGKRIVYI